MNIGKISVIVAVYNAEKFLHNCVNSIINQTHKSLEIILVDDGSLDSSGAICDEFAKKDNRIKVIHKINGGVSSARNMALDLARGEYITFVDADDTIQDDACSVLYTTAIQNNADIVICGMCIKEETQEYNICSPNKIYKDLDATYAYVLDEIRPEACGKLIKRSIIGDIRFNKEITYAEDLLFNYQIIKKSKCLMNISNCLYNYIKIGETSATSQYISEARIMGYKATKFIVDDCYKNFLLRDVALWRHIRGLFAILTRVILFEDDKFFDLYYDVLVDEILLYKSEVILNKLIVSKYKLSVLILKLNRKLYAKMLCFFHHK